MLLANEAEHPGERRDAAVLIAYLSVEIAPDDVTLGLLRTGTMSVIDDLAIVTSVARALATFPGDRWTFGRTVAVLARHAVADGHPAPLLCLLGRLLGVASWRPLADPALCRSALDWAFQDWPDRAEHAALLVHQGVIAFPEQLPGWILERQHDFPKLLDSYLLAPSIAWRLHRGAPSPDGWLHLAHARGSDVLDVSPAAFGQLLSNARASLATALEQESSLTVRDALLRWVAALGSEP